MKAKLIKWTAPLLTACMALSGWVTFGAISVIFWGEYEYPYEESEE